VTERGEENSSSDSDLDPEHTRGTFHAIVDAFKSSLGVASSSSSGTINRTSSGSRSSSDQFTTNDVSIGLHGHRLKVLNSLQGSPILQQRTLASIDVSLLDSPPHLMPSPPSTPPRTPLRNSANGCTPVVTPRSRLHASPRMRLLTGQKRLPASGTGQERTSPTSPTCRSSPAVSLRYSPTRDTVQHTAQDVFNAPDKQLTSTLVKRRPTYTDLKEYYITMLNHCQRFVPRMPNRYYQRLSDSEKYDPSWATHYTMMIREATPLEFASPDILVENTCNPEEEPCPPFEFLWTNNLILGHNVPASAKQTEGCDCCGPCDPYSETCACIQRQKKWRREWDIPDGGFLYNADGTLKDDHQFPVFECNETCGCSRSCMNRASIRFISIITDNEPANFRSFSMAVKLASNSRKHQTKVGVSVKFRPILPGTIGKFALHRAFCNGNITCI